MKRLFWLIIILALGISFWLYQEINQFQQETIDFGQKVVVQKSSQDEIQEKTSVKEEDKIPESINLEVPFTPQAPYAIWDETHQEACEEAAFLMVHYYYAGKDLSKEEAEKEILALVNFQNKTYGDYKDTDAEETAQVIRDYYGYKVEVKFDITIEDIKKEVAQARPVIVPAAGRLLGNPYYTPPGPLYHHILIRGYTPEEIITNDAGTKRGENYRYQPEVLENAIHDWNNGNIYQGRKAMIVIYPHRV